MYIIHHTSQYSRIQVQRHKLSSIRLKNLLLNLKKLHYWSLESALRCALMYVGLVLFKPFRYVLWFIHCVEGVLKKTFCNTKTSIYTLEFDSHFLFPLPSALLQVSHIHCYFVISYKHWGKATLQCWIYWFLHNC